MIDKNIKNIFHWFSGVYSDLYTLEITTLPAGYKFGISRRGECWKFGGQSSTNADELKTEIKKAMREITKQRKAAERAKMHKVLRKGATND